MTTRQHQGIIRAAMHYGQAFGMARDAAAKLDPESPAARAIWASHDPGEAMMEWFWHQRDGREE